MTTPGGVITTINVMDLRADMVRSNKVNATSSDREFRTLRMGPIDVYAAPDDADALATMEAIRDAATEIVNWLRHKTDPERPVALALHVHGAAAQPVDAARHVKCDACATDLTDDPRPGGFIYTTGVTWRVGPCCAKAFEQQIRGIGQPDQTWQYCPDDVSFADWIRSLRAQPAAGIGSS